jgi:hypothetical protein
MSRRTSKILQNLINSDEIGEQALLAKERSPPNSNFAQVCHERYNHMSVANGSPLDKCLKKSFGNKYSESPDFTCDSCLFNKTHQLPHPRLSKADRQLKNGDGAFAEIFLDTVSYPFPGENGERYMALLSNSGRQIACLCSKTKSETPDLVIKTLELWTNLYGKIDLPSTNTFWWNFILPQQGGNASNPGSRIAIMTYDGASEFMGSKMRNYLDAKGIMHRATCRYTPQQNAAENIVKLVTQGLETLLWQSGLPRIFWCRAAQYFCKVYELLPNSAARGKYVTPHEALMQKEIPFEKLISRIFAFGEEVFYHQPRELRAHTHGCPKSQRGILLGFSRRKKGYDILTETGAIIEGVFDVFFTGRFPLQLKRIGRQSRSSRQQM